MADNMETVIYSAAGKSAEHAESFCSTNTNNYGYYLLPLPLPLRRQQLLLLLLVPFSPSTATASTRQAAAAAAAAATAANERLMQITMLQVFHMATSLVIVMPVLLVNFRVKNTLKISFYPYFFSLCHCSLHSFVPLVLK